MKEQQRYLLAVLCWLAGFTWASSARFLQNCSAQGTKYPGGRPL